MKKIVEEENKTKPLEIEEKIEQIISEKIEEFIQKELPEKKEEIVLEEEII